MIEEHRWQRVGAAVLIQYLLRRWLRRRHLKPAFPANGPSDLASDVCEEVRSPNARPGAGEKQVTHDEPSVIESDVCEVARLPNACSDVGKVDPRQRAAKKKRGGKASAEAEEEACEFADLTSTDGEEGAAASDEPSALASLPGDRKAIDHDELPEFASDACEEVRLPSADLGLGEGEAVIHDEPSVPASLDGDKGAPANDEPSLPAGDPCEKARLPNDDHGVGKAGRRQRAAKKKRGTKASAEEGDCDAYLLAAAAEAKEEAKSILAQKAPRCEELHLLHVGEADQDVAGQTCDICNSTLPLDTVYAWCNAKGCTSSGPYCSSCACQFPSGDEMERAFSSG